MQLWRRHSTQEKNAIFAKPGSWRSTTKMSRRFRDIWIVGQKLIQRLAPEFVQNINDNLELQSSAQDSWRFCHT